MELVVGRIGRPHGIRGEVTVEVRTDSPDRRFAVGERLRTEPATAGPLLVAAARWHSGRLLLAFEGVADREGAEALRNVVLVVEVDAEERPEDAEEFYDHQLLGLRVQTVGGEDVGTIAQILHLPSQELLAVRTGDGAEVLIPFVTKIVPEIDLDARVVRIDPPPGLLGDLGG